MRRHTSYLAVASLFQGYCKPGGRDAFTLADRWVTVPYCGLLHTLDTGWESRAIFQCNAFAELVELLIAWRAFNLDPVCFGLFGFRLREAGLQHTVIGQNQQTFAVLVEPSCRVNVFTG